MNTPKIYSLKSFSCNTALLILNVSINFIINFNCSLFSNTPVVKLYPIKLWSTTLLNSELFSPIKLGLITFQFSVPEHNFENFVYNYYGHGDVLNIKLCYACIICIYLDLNSGSALLRVYKLNIYLCNVEFIV